MKKRTTSPAATVAILSDDLLSEFFIRLPDLPSLDSASLVSKRWRRVAFDPAIRRRFDVFRRPPLLGVIFSDRGDEHFPRRCPKLCFVPSHTGHPRHAAAAGVGDFSFEDLRDDFKKKNGGGVIRRNDDKWRLRGSDGGLLLLSHGVDSRDLAVYDPFARTAVFFPPPDALRKWWHIVTYAIITDEADGSFRVIATLFLHYLEAAIFSSRTRDWNPVPAAGVEFNNCGRSDGIRAGRFAYWRSDNKKYYDYDDVEEIFVLDIVSMEWSVINAPFEVGESYCVADMAEHGGLCLVSSKEQCLQIWVHDDVVDDDEWVPKKEVELLKEFGVLKNLRKDEWMKRVRVLAVRGDHVLMEFWSIRKSHSYLLMLNLRTMKLDMFRNDATEPYRGTAFPLFLLPELPLPALAKQKTLNVQGV